MERINWGDRKCILRLHEFEDMSFALHVLRETDLFVDIGANIGSYTILSASEKQTKTIAFEPIPATFNHLINNIKINHIEDRVEALNIGIGDETSTVKFTSSLDTMNHVIVDGNSKDTVDVSVKKLDNILGLDRPTIIKIDVEGFERKVIDGMKNILKSIIEFNGSSQKYGFNDDEFIKNCLKKRYFHMHIALLNGILID